MPEQNPTELANAIERVMDNPELYASMSRATAATWDILQCPAKLELLILHWVSETESDRAGLLSMRCHSSDPAPERRYRDPR